LRLTAKTNRALFIFSKEKPHSLMRWRGRGAEEFSFPSSRVLLSAGEGRC
jgi:hypothetical protein